MKTTGEVLQEIRLARGISVITLSRLSGIQMQTIYKIEQRKTDVTVNTARIILAALKTGLAHLDELLPPIDLPPPPPPRKLRNWEINKLMKQQQEQRNQQCQ